MIPAAIVSAPGNARHPAFHEAFDLQQEGAPHDFGGGHVRLLHDLPDVLHLAVTDSRRNYFPLGACVEFASHDVSPVVPDVVLTMLFADADRFSLSDHPAPQYPGKDPFLGHDAVAGLVVDGTAGMAFLADLGHFQQCLT